MKTIKVNLGKRSYNIYIGSGIISKAGTIIRRLDIGDRAVIITNPLIKGKFSKRIVASLRSCGIGMSFIEVPDSEKAKSIKYAFNLIEKIASLGRGRRLFLIAFGGGVIGDLAGFAASVYKRGIPYIQVPTTLLAQVDSGIGGKTGIDLDSGKNLCGAFYQPKAVISDISFLDSLKPKQIRAGLSEVVKYGLIKDKKLFSFIEREHKKILACNRSVAEKIVKSCADIKADIVSRDEREDKGLRTILNFGHTIAHAIEKAGGYKHYGHGEAVALGLVAESNISSRMGMLSLKEYKRITGLIKIMRLSKGIRALSIKSIMQAQAYDKKFLGRRNRFALIKGIGSAVVRENIPASFIRRSLEELKAGLV